MTDGVALGYDSGVLRGAVPACSGFAGIADAATQALRSAPLDPVMFGLTPGAPAFAAVAAVLAGCASPPSAGPTPHPYWRTAASTESRECHAFLAVGPARPDTVVHVAVQNEAVEAPLSSGGAAHSCVFTETLVSATSLALQES